VRNLLLSFPDGIIVEHVAVVFVVVVVPNKFVFPSTVTSSVMFVFVIRVSLRLVKKIRLYMLTSKLSSPNIRHHRAGLIANRVDRASNHSPSHSGHTTAEIVVKRFAVPVQAHSPIYLSTVIFSVKCVCATVV